MAATALAVLEPPAERRERLILECLPEVRWVARSLAARLPPACALEDLEAAGAVGLISAIDNFDQRYNVKLTTYVHHRIRGAMLDSLRAHSGEPFRYRKARRRIAAATAALEQRLQRAPQEEEVAAEIGLPLPALQQLKLRVRPVRLCSVDGRVGGAGGRPVAETIRDPRHAHPGARLERAELASRIKAFLLLLPCREREVLLLHFVQGLSLTAISRRLGRHASRISQLKDQALHRLRRHMGAAAAGVQRASMR